MLGVVPPPRFPPGPRPPQTPPYPLARNALWLESSQPSSLTPLPITPEQAVSTGRCGAAAPPRSPLSAPLPFPSSVLVAHSRHHPHGGGEGSVPGSALRCGRVRPLGAGRPCSQATLLGPTSAAHPPPSANGTGGVCTAALSTRRGGLTADLRHPCQHTHRRLPNPTHPSPPPPPPFPPTCFSTPPSVSQSRAAARARTVVVPSWGGGGRP